MVKYDSFRGRPVWLELTVAAAVIGGAAADYLCYVAFLREKNWGRSKMGIAAPDELEMSGRDPRHPVRIWVRAALIDTVLSMVMIVFIASAFSILGTVILQGQQLVPEKDQELLLHQSQFLTKLSSSLLPLYQIAVFLAFFGNVYGGPELAAHVYNEFFRSTPALQNWVSIIWTLLGGLGVM